MAEKKFNIKDQLAGIAALIAAIVAIGGGFVKYGEITTKLDAIEAREQVVVDTTSIETSIAVLEEKVAALENVEGVDLSSLEDGLAQYKTCLLYTSPSPRDRQKSRMPSSA